MKISVLIKNLEWYRKEYGDVEVAIHSTNTHKFCGTDKDGKHTEREEKADMANLFFDMSIGDTMCSSEMKEKRIADKLWIQNYPY